MGRTSWFKSGFDNDVIGFDFEGTLWDPARAILEGRSPYPAPVESEVEVGNPALYPPLSMLVVSPLDSSPWSIGVAVWAVILAAGDGRKPLHPGSPRSAGATRSRRFLCPWSPVCGWGI